MKCLVLCCLMVRTFKNIDGDVDDVFLTVSVFHALVSNVIIAVCLFFFLFSTGLLWKWCFVNQ